MRRPSQFDPQLTGARLGPVFGLELDDPRPRSLALWWAHVLPCRSHRCQNRSKIGLPALQRLLQCRWPAGLHRLPERIADCSLAPSVYTSVLQPY